MPAAILPLPGAANSLLDSNRKVVLIRLFSYCMMHCLAASIGGRARRRPAGKGARANPDGRGVSTEYAPMQR
jgi:hypothetical protein